MPRHVCEACGTIHYQNPRIVAGCVCEWESKILLCKRAIEPRSGFWTVPAGFMENGETVEQAAARETQEEAQADVTIDSLLAMVNVPHVNQVHIMFRGSITDGKYGVGHESTEVMLVHEDDIPWDEIAFPSVRFSLEKYLHDRLHGRRDVHTTNFDRRKL